MSARSFGAKTAAGLQRDAERLEVVFGDDELECRRQLVRGRDRLAFHRIDRLGRAEDAHGQARRGGHVLHLRHRAQTIELWSTNASRWTGVG